MSSTQDLPPRPRMERPQSQGSDTTLAVEAGSFDFERSLKRLTERRRDAQFPHRELGVLFEDLRVVGLGATASFQPSMADIFGAPIGIFQAIKAGRHPQLRDILSGWEGVVRPGEMLLVLGRPGSGCSTLLKTLANQRGEYHSVHGTVSYDSLTPKLIASQYRHDVYYSAEDDVHFPSLTVEQTVEFAAKTRGPQNRVGGQTRKEHDKYITDLWTAVFGLTHAKKTLVGDAQIRGVSGGEKKRVSISEAMTSRALVNSWDNSTRGLDASTALEFARALRVTSSVEKHTTIVSLYQAGEPIYELFDKVAVVYEGRMAYFGPANKARQYFIDLGYQPAHRQTTADFVVSVTDPLARIPRELAPNKPTPPRTAAEFAEYFLRSDEGAANKKDMEAYRAEFIGKPQRLIAYKESVVAEHAKHTRNRSAYTVSIPMQLRAVMLRRVQIIKGDWASQALGTMLYVVEAVILGSTFVNTPTSTDAYFSRGGLLFFSLFLPALFSSAEIPSLFAQRPIILRHQKAGLYHPFVEALAMTIVDIPFTFISLSLYSLVLYFITDLQRTAGQFFIFFLFIFTNALSMKAFFRGLSAAMGSAAPAQAVGGILLLALAFYTGYHVSLTSMHGALKWISYINPLRYSFESMMANEFGTIDGQCTNLVPSGAGYETVSLANQVCTTVGSQPGRATVDGNAFITLSYNYHHYNLWRNFGIVIAFGIFFLIWLLFFTEMNTGSTGTADTTLYKRGAKVAEIQEASDSADEEKHHGEKVHNTIDAEALARAKAVMLAEMKTRNVFSWQNIKYTVPVAGDEKYRVLLDEISGYVAPGKLMALMGESGAGKTTLLNVLAERAGTGVVTGDRFVNGQALPKDFGAQTGYCQQTDTHVPTQTVREALVFSARMRQPSTVPTAEKDAYAEKVLTMCGLEAFGDAIVGSLNVENRKRTTIGVELAARPQLLLFLDEPTSGLDAQSAWAIVQFLRSLADSGQAILCTIHQPSSELFQMFDQLLLLRKGGQTVFFGDLGARASKLIEYFEGFGSRKCGAVENPAEFMLDAIGAGATATADRDWHEAWIRSQGAVDLQNQLDVIHEEGRSRPPVAVSVPTTYATSWFYQAKALTARNWQSKWRTPDYPMSKISLNIMGGLFIGFTTYRAKDSIVGTQNKLFSIFMGVILSSPLGSVINVPFIADRNIFEIRERSSRMYHWSAFITSQILVELPWNIFSSSIFFLTWFWTVGFKSDRAGYTYFMFGVLFPAYYTTFALATASLAPNVDIAGLLFAFLLSLVIIFSGVIQPFGQLGWATFIYRVSPYNYLISGLLGQSTGHNQINCADKEFATLQPPSGSTCISYLANFISTHGGYVSNPNDTSTCRYCPNRTTDEFLGPTFNIKYSTHWRDLGIFCAFIVFNTVLIYLFTYLFRIQTGSPVSFIKKRLARRI